jgi:Dimerisation domain
MTMLAGMQLDLFTPLKNGPLLATEIAAVVGVDPQRLEVLLYSLVRAALLTVNSGRFGNAPEADAFLVRGCPGYLGGSHELYSDLWSNLLKIAGRFVPTHRSVNMTSPPCPMPSLERSSGDCTLGLLRGSGAKLVGISRGVISGLNFNKPIWRLAAAEGDKANDDRYSKRAGW